MASLVIVKIALRSEGQSTALRTDEGSLLTMNLGMNTQIMPFSEALVAVRKTAHKWLGPQMQMEMGA